MRLTDCLQLASYRQIISSTAVSADENIPVSSGYAAMNVPVNRTFVPQGQQFHTIRRAAHAGPLQSARLFQAVNCVVDHSLETVAVRRL